MWILSIIFKGQTKTAVELSPIRIVKNPDGTLNRAAMTGAVLAKERRELKQQKAAENKNGENDEEDSTSTKIVSGDIRRRKQEVSYGKRTDLSINEQRQTLPIYKLRDTLVKAIDENQVMIVVGDTGSGKVI